MAKLTLYYATNRKHEGKDRWNPTGYGNNFSDDGMENLRFGMVMLDADDNEIKAALGKNMGACGKGDGESLAKHLTKCAETATIQAYPEKIDRKLADGRQKNARFGSLAMFTDLKSAMEKNSDALIYIHGFNVSWHEAVGAALALELMLNNSALRDPEQHVLVILFTWPSDGLALPYVSYKSDRSEAAGSGYAVGRGLLKARDFLAALGKEGLCGQGIHLLCHSMGNYLLQNALKRIDQFTPGNALPRLFGHIFLCAPDVDDSVLEPGYPMGRVHELARSVSVYHNRGDVAMVVSDYTKGNPERLGSGGAARPSLLHNKVNQVDCTPIVSGLVEHSYYLGGHTNADIRQSIDGLSHDDKRRRRTQDGKFANVWRMT